MAASLWRILLKLEETGVALTCDECFVILEFLADQAINGADMVQLLASVERHLARCPECYEHHLQRLHELERGI